MFNLRYLYFILFFAAAFFAATFPAWANAQPPNSQTINIPSWLGVGGGAGAGCGLGVAIKSKVDKILQFSGQGETITAAANSYTNSFPYLKDKLKVLASQIMKLTQQNERLNRRFNYLERQLIKNLENYQSYDDHKNHKITL